MQDFWVKYHDKGTIVMFQSIYNSNPYKYVLLYEYIHWKLLICPLNLIMMMFRFQITIKLTYLVWSVLQTYFINLSTFFASCRASSNLSSTSAFNIGFISLILSINAFTTSSLDNWSEKIDNKNINFYPYNKIL